MIHFFEYTPDGLKEDVRISSGAGQTNAITSVEIVDQCNTGDDLRVGSACCSMAKIFMFTPHGGFDIAPGKRISLYDKYDDGEEILVGCFVVDSTSRPTPNTYVITAFDFMSLYDVDISDFLSTGKYADKDYIPRLQQLVYDLCENYIDGEGIKENDIYEDMVDIRAPISQRIMTGRDLLSYAAEIMACYVHVTRNGTVEFRWFEQTDKTYSPSGRNYYFSGSLNAAAYKVRGVDAVQIRHPSMIVGGSYPKTLITNNTYIVENNPLVSYPSESDMDDLYDRIYESLFYAQYTPCTFRCAYTKDAPRPGDIITIVDRNGKSITTYVMRTRLKKNVLTVESWGNKMRNVASSSNYTAPKAVSVSKTYANEQVANIEQAGTNGWKLDISRSTITLYNGAQKKRAEITHSSNAQGVEFVYINIYNTNGTLAGGFAVGSSDMQIAAHDIDTNTLSWKRVGWKNVNGVKTLVSY